MRMLGSSVGGAFLSGASIPLVALLLSMTEPSRDLTLVFPHGSPLVMETGTGELTVAVLPGTDLERVTATIDGDRVDVRAAPEQLTFALQDLAPGGHLLEVGIVHRGGVRRLVSVPLIVGPFRAREDVLENAITLQLAATVIDDGDPETDSDLMSAIAQRILAGAPHHPVLGSMRSCNLRFERNADPHGGELHGAASFDGGGLGFVVPIRFERPTETRLGLARAGAVRVSLDERLMVTARVEGQRIGRERGGQLGREWGSRLSEDWGARAGQAIGEFLGERLGAEEGQAQAQGEVAASVQEMADRFLPELGDALILPERIDLDRYIEGVSMTLLFHGPPTFVSDGSLSLDLDARLTGIERPARLGRSPLLSRGRASITGTGMRVSQDLIAEFMEAYSVRNLDRDLEQALDTEGGGLRLGPLEIRGLSSEAAVILDRNWGRASLSDVPPEAEGFGWTLPDIGLETNLQRDLRAVVRGTVQISLRDQTRVVLSPTVTSVGLSCRDGSGRAFPCLSDATSLVPNLPEKLTNELHEVVLFEDALREFSSFAVSGEGEFRLSFDATSLETSEGGLLLFGDITL